MTMAKQCASNTYYSVSSMHPWRGQAIFAPANGSIYTSGVDGRGRSHIRGVVMLIVYYHYYYYLFWEGKGGGERESLR